MLNDRIKRNIWLTLAILSLAAIAERASKIIDGSGGWWDLLSAIIITAFCTKFYLCYRKKVKCASASENVGSGE